jgi:hypothetical protein
MKKQSSQKQKERRRHKGLTCVGKSENIIRKREDVAFKQAPFHGERI